MKPVNLALQGGGSHGAFTWGVLDALLEDETLHFPALSGTSAGAINAVVLASGWAVAVREGRPPREGARQALRAVWEQVVSMSAYGALQRELLRVFFRATALAPTPLPFNPLRALLEKLVNFDALQDAAAPRVHVGATHVRTGRAAVFSGSALTPDAVLASACLPQAFPPVVIGGDTYWDGGYSVNPPLTPFLRESSGGDVLLVQINPVRLTAVPALPAEVAERASELTFNAGLLSQVRAVWHFNQLMELGVMPHQRKVRLHRIDGGEPLQRFPQSTRATAHSALVSELFSLGRDAAAQWLRTHAAALGSRDTLSYAEYEDDTWLKLQEQPVAAGWRARMGAVLRTAAGLR